MAERLHCKWNHQLHLFFPLFTFDSFVRECSTQLTVTSSTFSPTHTHTHTSQTNKKNYILWSAPTVLHYWVENRSIGCVSLFLTFFSWAVQCRGGHGRLIQVFEKNKKQNKFSYHIFSRSKKQHFQSSDSSYVCSQNAFIFFLVVFTLLTFYKRTVSVLV